MNNNTKWAFYLPVIIAFSIVAGFFIGSYFYASPNRAQLLAGKNKINAILEIIDQHYVDTVNINELIDKTAISLINELDPHSVLIPAEDLIIVSEPLEGSFSGIGVSFNLLSDSILVLKVTPGGPAEKAGLLPFDRIVTINDSIFAGRKFPDYEIQRTLRGPKNTKVRVGVKRAEVSDLIYFDITRGDVPSYSIDASYVVSNEIGYIKIKNFAKTTYNEFLTAIAKHKSEGCKKYIIDLRGNSGGVMETAIRMINEFLPARKPIVYAEGKAFKRLNSNADGTGTCQDSPLVVLIDEFSGSASEIFAGAIQDNDRGMIIGRRSYGKGVVQTPIPLKDGSELRLTIARYYTPSGRCVQKNYEMGNSADYEQDLQTRWDHGEFFFEDSIKMNDSLVYKTLGGRTVYGGGGIMPDIFVPRDTNRFTSYYLNVYNSGTIHQFSLEYSDRNHKQFGAFESQKDLMRYLQRQPILDEFIRYAESKGINRRPTLIEISKDLIENNIYAYIVRNFFDDSDYYSIIQKDDNTINRAVQVLNNGEWKPLAAVPRFDSIEVPVLK